MSDKQYGIAGKKMILAVSAQDLPLGVDMVSGLHTLTESMMLSMLHNAGLWIGPREDLEKMPHYRQIIPYVVLRHEGSIVYYRRTPAGNEPGLHEKVSIGLGGHIDFGDIVSNDEGGVNLGATLTLAADREVHEELHGVSAQHKQILGLLVDNDLPVGRVHIGVAQVWDLDSLPGGSSEAEIANVGMAPLETLRDMSANFEAWTQILLNSTCLVR